MTFVQKVRGLKGIDECLKTGLEALKKSDKTKIQCNNTRLIEGSVDIDSCLQSVYPHENRWDYVIGYDGLSYFVEIHPADTSQVEIVLKKYRWLKEFLKNEGSPLLDQSASFHWIVSGGVNIAKSSPQSRKLATSGLLGSKSHCRCG